MAKCAPLRRGLCAAVWLLGLLGSAPLRAASAADSLYHFAAALDAEEDDYRAIGEYKRFRFLYPQDPRAPRAGYRIGLAYLRGKQFEAAAPYLEAACRGEEEALAAPGCFSLATLAWREERYDLAQQRYREVQETFPQSPLSAMAGLRRGWVFLEAGQYRQAQEAFLAVPGAGEEARQGRQLAIEAQRLAVRPERNPYWAGAASALLPGSGQLLARHPYEALAAFAVVGLSAFGAAESFRHGQSGFGIFLCAFGGSFYLGNIASAINLTARLNLKERRQNLQRLQQRYPLGGEPE